MKTPRDILLERHQAAVPKLDAVRRESVGQASRLSPFEGTRQLETGKMPVLILLWRELIFPSRRIWAGLAAVWLLIFAVNLSMRDHSPSGVMVSAPPQMMLTFRQQQQLLTELLGPDETRVAEPATPFLPRPRSEGRIEIFMT